MQERLWRVGYSISNNRYKKGKSIEVEARTQGEAVRIAIWRAFKTAEVKYDFIIDYDLAGKEPFIQVQNGDEFYYIDSFFAIPEN